MPDDGFGLDHLPYGVSRSSAASIHAATVEASGKR